jgi:hypothetical protein
LRKQMDDTIANAAASNFDAGAATRYRAAADFTRQQHEQFGNQFIQPLLDTRGAVGDFKVPDTNVGGKIIANNESAQAYLAAGGDAATLKGALVDDLYGSLRGGELTPQKLQQFRSDREGAIRAVPGLDAELGNFAGAQDLVGQLAQTRANQMAQANTGSIKRIAEGDVQPQVSSLLVASPLSNTGRNATSEMMRLWAAAAGDPAAEAGLQRAVMQHIDNEFIDSATGQFRTNSSISCRLNVVRSRLQSDLMACACSTIWRDLAPGSTRRRPAARRGRDGFDDTIHHDGCATAGKSPLGSSLVGRRDWAALTGAPAIVAAPAVGIGLGAMLVRNLRAAGIGSRADLMAQAMSNPPLARALALKATPANVPFIERAIQGALLALGCAGGVIRLRRGAATAQRAAPAAALRIDDQVRASRHVDHIGDKPAATRVASYLARQAACRAISSGRRSS